MLNISNVPNAAINGRNKYLTILDSTWQEHLQPRADNAPTVISTFAGCGGSSLGYSMAGFRELAAVEWDGNAVDTFQLNFPGIPVYYGDICALSVDDLLEMAEIKPGKLDVLDGSPPCQGFSIAGKRDMSDDRNQLFREFVRLLRGLKPKVFVMENVSGMVKGKMKLIFADIMRELKASRYKVSARLMNTMYFNVPQSRERMIFIGVREDLGMEPSHPKAEGRPFTVRWALENVKQGDPGLFKSGQVARIIHEMQPGEDGSKASERLSRNSNKWFNMRRLARHLPGFTITKSHGASTLIHPELDRACNQFEFMRLGSFPDSFTFVGNYQQIKERIGNSVPPLFMRAIANHIRHEILDRLTGGVPVLVKDG